MPLRFHRYVKVPKGTKGVDDNAEVTAVSVSPNTALPLIVTVPPKTGGLPASVLNDAAALLRDAKWVGVSFKRCVNE